MTSAEQISRLLALVPYLQRHPDAELAATAEEFGVTDAQLMSDLRVLWYCGLPGGLPGDLIEIDMDTVESTGKIRLSNAEYLERPVRFSPDEAMSLLVALRAVAELADSELGGPVATALAKLEAASGSVASAVVAVESGRSDVGDPLRAAIRDGVLVEIDYTDAGLDASTPVVAPVRLLTRDGFGYLQAWNLDRRDWRTYRLDRIDQVRMGSTPIGELPDPPEFAEDWLASSPDAMPVTLHLRPQAAWVAEYIPIRGIRNRGDILEVDLLVADPAWLRALVLRLGADLIWTDPPEAMTSARSAAAEALAVYSAG